MDSDDETPERVHVCVRIPKLDSERLFYSEEELQEALEAIRLVEPVTHEGLEFEDIFSRRCACIYHAEKVKEAGDPVAAMEGFITAMDAGIYPSLAILEFLRDRFLDYLKAGSRKSLDEVLGLASRGPGVSPALKTELAQRREYRNNRFVHLLRVGFGIPIGDAAAMVAEREAPGMAKEVIDWGGKMLTGETIDSQYRRKWRAQFGKEDPRADFFMFSGERGLEFLESFPAKTVGVRTRTRLEAVKKKIREEIAISRHGGK